MTDQQNQTSLNMNSLSAEERQFVQKAMNAGLAVSFTPNGGKEPITFTPSKAQIENASMHRKGLTNTEQGMAYATLLNNKKKNSSIAVISSEEADQIPYMPNMRSTFFDTLSPETKKFVLEANLNGLNVTAKSSNGKSFLYLAPQNDQARNLMRQELKTLEQETQNTLSDTQQVVTTTEVTQPQILKANQHQ